MLPDRKEIALIIRTENGTLVNFQSIKYIQVGERIYAGAIDSDKIVDCFPLIAYINNSSDTVLVSKFPTKEDATFALDTLYRAFVAGDKCFDFPKFMQDGRGLAGTRFIF